MFNLLLFLPLLSFAITALANADHRPVLHQCALEKQRLEKQRLEKREEVQDTGTTYLPNIIALMSPACNVTCTAGMLANVAACTSVEGATDEEVAACSCSGPVLASVCELEILGGRGRERERC